MDESHVSIPASSADELITLASINRFNVNDHWFSIVPNVLDASVVAMFCRLLEAARERENSENVANASGTYGLRNLTDVAPETVELVRHERVAQIVTAELGSSAFMVRATLFDKTPGANWGVFWHQDLSIAVEHRCDVNGFSAWTRKAGVHCVQPPVELMLDILAVRLHLDDCSAENGALKVLPGTHCLSKLTSLEVEAQTTRSSEVTCEVAAGGAILMRPLLLHASSPMEKPLSRRVIHFEFANFELPEPLRWKYRIPCIS